MPRECDVETCDRPHYARGWCELHYRRTRRRRDGDPTRPSAGELGPRPCAVPTCDRDAKTRGWCHAHYQRWRRHGDVQADLPLSPDRGCEVDGCDRGHYARGWCAAHYRRWQKHGDVQPEQPLREIDGSGSISHGYRKVPVPAADLWLTEGETYTLEHRYVVARLLGRPLTSDEVVHHRNGDRLDNRPANLELWSTSQPKGQRIGDKVDHALDILRRYAPHRLAGNDEGTSS